MTTSKAQPARQRRLRSNRLVEFGYFPRELPACFSPNTLATHAAALTALTKAEKKSKSATFSCARFGRMRRVLSVPNPYNFLQTADFFETNWLELAQLAQSSPLSASKPVLKKNGIRAIERLKPDGDLVEMRSWARANARYIVKADISQFYHSIYSHSIPWAIHTKQTAKKRQRDNSLIGNQLDTLVRNAQDAQTIGIPIGPDTSLVLAEIILSDIDKKLKVEFPELRGFRYVDDYELCFFELADAEKALSKLEGLLATYELRLNPKKTSILQLPQPLDHSWTAILRHFPERFSRKAADQKWQLIDFFELAFEQSNKSPDEQVLTYAVGRLLREATQIAPQNWQLVQALLCQVISIEGGAIPVALQLWTRYTHKPYLNDRPLLEKVLNNIIRQHAPLGHSSEVAFSLWGILRFGLSCEADNLATISQMTDPFVGLLALDGKVQGKFAALDLGFWSDQLSERSLYEENWILVYEALTKKWLTPKRDFVSRDGFFNTLRQKGVSFYEPITSTSRFKNPRKTVQPPKKTFAEELEDQIRSIEERLVLPVADPSGEIVVLEGFDFY